ncbi:MAG: YceI family protein [Campylobacteraceae bacterium]
MKKILLSILVISSFAFAENIEIHGTSTFHDWKMVSNETSVIFESGDNQITKLEVSALVESLKSGDTGLDKKAYEAMKTKVNPNISFVLESADLEKGTLTGVFKILETEEKVTIKPEILTTTHVAGNFTTKMTTYGVIPPSVLFVKSGDEIVVKYDIKKPE